MAELTLDQANQLITAALETARGMDLPPLAVAVLDAGGHLKALQREDGVSFLRVQVCQAKAWGALGLGEDSSDIARRCDESRQQQGFLTALDAMTNGGVVPLPGGVLVRAASGQVVGAVGVAGAASDDDETCARAAIEAIGLCCSS